MTREPETLTPQAMALGEALASVRAKAKADGPAYKVAEVRFMPFAHYPWWVEMACGDVKVYADWPPALSFALGVPVVARDEAAELRAAVKLYLARLDDYEADQYPRGSIARLKKNKALEALRAALAASEGQP